MSDNSRPPALSASAFGRSSSNAAKSPTKAGPARAAAGTLLRRSVDDVSYRQTDSARAPDQAQAPGAVAGDGDVAGHLLVPSAGQDSVDRQSKYMNLLSTVYSHNPVPKLKIGPGAVPARQAHGPAAPAGIASRQVSAAGCVPAAAGDGPIPPPLRSSASPKGLTGVPSKGSSTGVSLRRSVRASILDSSQGPSLIPPSPDSGAAAASSATVGSHRPQHVLSPGAGAGKGLAATQGVTSPTLLSRLRTSTGSTGSVSRLLHTKEPASPVRHSAPGAQPKVQHAFGSRIDAAAAASASRARASPTRLVPAAAAAAPADRFGGIRASASPQRVPAAGRASAQSSAAAGPLRSASAPRMSSADKLQSRLTQHTITAEAALRSRTPNPAAGSSAAAAGRQSFTASGGSGASAARRLRTSAHAAASESKHVARMRSSDSALGAVQHTRLPSFSSTLAGTRSPTKGSPAGSAGSPGSPGLRGAAGSRSLLAGAAGLAARPGSAGRAVPASAAAAVAVGSRVKSAGARVERLVLSGAAGGAVDASAAASTSQDGFMPGVMVPLIKDRYKDLYKHTPAAIAVEEARAAAAAAAAAAGATAGTEADSCKPRGAAAVPKLALGGLTRQHSLDALAAPRGEHRQHQQHLEQQHMVEQQQQQQHLVEQQQQQQQPQPQQGGFSTPQGPKTVVPLLALSTITPQPKTKSAAGALAAAEEGLPCTPPQRDTPHPSQPQGATLQQEGGTACDIQLTPCPSATPMQDDTPSLLLKQQPRTGSSSKAGRDDDVEPGSPQLAPRNLSSGMQAVQGGGGSSGSGAAGCGSPAAAGIGLRPSLQLKGVSTTANIGSRSDVGAATRGLPIPALHLQAAAPGQPAATCFDSPPKHKRGEPEPTEPAAAPANQQVAKAKVQPCAGGANSSSGDRGSGGGIRASSSSSTGLRRSVSPAGRIPGSTAAGRVGPSPGNKAAGTRTRQRVGSAGSSVLEAAAAAEAGRGKAVPALRRSLTGSSPGDTGGGMRQEPEAGDGRGGRSTPLASPSKRPSVPRLDLTPVLAIVAAELETPSSAGPEGGMLLLEAPPQPRRLELDDSDDVPHTSSGRRPASTKSRAGSGRGSGAAVRQGSSKTQGPHSIKKGGVPGSRGSQHSAEPPPPESYYVYESVLPPEEQRTYEELRKVLLKTPGGNKHAANLQGIWGCYQDARRNTEAMAFRGHRLLDQVSTEYSTFKRDAEAKLQHLEQECDKAREELQLAMVAGSVPATALQLAAKDKQVRQLQEENGMLRQQVEEMEKALQMASDYHSATQAAHQAQQVPVHARVIAESATTNILTNLTLEQQMRLQQSEKRIEDMKAALHLACGVLRQTNYMEPQSDLRAQLDSDTLTVLDTIMATEEMEAGLAEAAAQQHQHSQDQPGLLLQDGMFGASLHGDEPSVHIEEVPDVGVAPAFPQH